jgi:4-hydroxy-3-methylbut-2-enyl diphosphate reductase
VTGSPLLVVPLLAERAALGRRAPAALRVGGGPRRAAAAADRIRSELDSGRYAALLVTGTCGGLAAGMHPGDLVVASEVDGPGRRPIRCLEPDLLVEELTAALRPLGRMVHIGRIYTADHLVDGPERAAVAATGAVAVDTESALLAAAAGDRPVLVVRAVSDTPAHPLRSVGIVRNGLSALRSLRAAAQVLANLSVPSSTLAPEDQEREVG